MTSGVEQHNQDTEALKKEAAYCMNCDERLMGQYCYACGQKNIGPRLNSRLMLHNLFESLTELNSKPWRTVIGLLKNPGSVARAYIGGARSAYINPIRYLILTFAIYMAFLAANGWLEVAFSQSVQSNGGPGIDADSQETASRLLQELKNVMAEKRDILTFLIVPIYSFLLRWIFFKTERNFAETLTYTCYVLGQYQVYSLLVALVAFLAPAIEYQGTPSFVFPIIMIISVYGFYQKHWFKTLLMGIFGFVLYVLLSWGVAFGLAYLALQIG